MNPAAIRALTAAQVLAALGRPDLERRLRVAAARVTRPATVVCVVGEFKQGKTSLVNALLGEDLLPVDDDLATSAVTLVHHADDRQVVVRRRDSRRAVVERIELGALPEVATEAGNPRNERAIELIEVGLPHPLLASGLSLVDTPGMGSIGAGHAAATMAFLPYADGMIFVTSATAELAAPERDFLVRALRLCPTVLLALTRTDLAPAWRRIAELDRAHLAEAGIAIPVLPLASPLRQLARLRGDSALERESGVPGLEAAMEHWVVRPAKARASERADAESAAVVAQLLQGYRAELAAVERSADAVADASLRETRERLARLRGLGARWSVLLSDRMSDISNRAMHDFRAALRAIQQAAEEPIERLKTPAEWEELGRSIAADVSDEVGSVFARVEEAASALRLELAELVGEPLDISVHPVPEAPDVAALWRATPIGETGSLAGRVAGQSLAGLRGAQSGIILFGVIASLLPAALGALVVTAPVTLGLGAAFAGGQLVVANRRKIEARRQQARTAIRQFLDEIQFEAGDQLGEAVRRLQRELRDDFTDRVAELTRTYADAIQRGEAAARQGEADRSRRAAEIRAAIERLEKLRQGAPAASRP